MENAHSSLQVRKSDGRYVTWRIASPSERMQLAFGHESGEASMRVQSSRQVAVLWTWTGIIFLLTAFASSSLRPKIPSERPPLSYYVGLLGLLAIGFALALTWEWVGRAGPAARLARVGIRAGILLLGVLWTLAMVFPFL